MSSIIQTISYQKEEARPINDKLGDLIGIHQLTITLEEGKVVEGVVSEVGKDYIVVIEGDHDTVIPTSRILCFQYAR